ncbi:hypothetical protein KFL_006550050 [Klebsormidium nitens]|uniref:SWIM-type domain-containing protein n=1 Tax=Klebsormidium nitens TaxID=105231 RepID=A0A1Y1II45_KLENI|nr:hypothetical protein KFL_006550050 [Klebsormidium nitens]|eukprot:GAQ90555.1 hypothetical protein KFL_006550050 [Klebsormidium nitens]
MELVDSHCTGFNSGITGSSGQLSSGQVRVEPATLKRIASGYFRVDYQQCQLRVAVKCLTCAQQLWVKDTSSTSGGSDLRLTFRKGQESDVSNGLYKGYLISSEVPKGKQTKQVVCLSCIERLLGSIAESADGQSIILGCRRDGGAEAVILRRQHGAAFWTQCLELTTEILAFLSQRNESTVVRKKRALNAAERVINRGAAKGVRQRGPQEGEIPATTDAGGADELSVDASIKSQASRYLDMIGNGGCHISVPAESACPPLRLYMPAWDHNGRGRAKPLGKPDKSCALLEQVWWDTLGQLNCTCDRGRLTEDAPCVHKLAMAALSESWIRWAEMPTRQMLGQGVRVERLASDEKGSYFAVRDNPNGVSRRMVFRSKGGCWYCEGKRDGCPSLTDCSHIGAAKAALIKGEVPTTEALVLGSGSLARAATSWLESFDGRVPLIGAPAVELSSGSEGNADRDSGSSRGGEGERGEEGKEGLSDEERYLLGLLERRPHKEAACAGDSCFCKRHEFLFGEARPPTEERREGQEGGHDAGVSNEMTEGGPALKRARRSKAFWKAEAQRPTEVARSGANGRSGQRSGPSTDARGKDAIHGWVAACSNCKLSFLAAGGACKHEKERHSKVPVMLLSTEATQVSKPKLARLSDAPNFHDPWVTALSGSPVRVSRLRDCHFKELSDLGLLNAPCPLDPPPCGGSWVEREVEASVTASQWSQRVRVRLYHCNCPDEAHTIHFDGEHLGLYTWNRRTLFVQQSLQLLLRGMQHGHSFKAELATNQTAFQQCPEAEVLSEETWRRASLDFFKLLGLGIRDCCTLCGPHPKVLLCDGIVGLANSDGGKRPGGLGSTTLDIRRTMVHPSVFENGQLLQKRSISGQDYCGAGLEGGGMKRKLILQPELREAIARLSQHRPKDEKLG